MWVDPIAEEIRQIREKYFVMRGVFSKSFGAGETDHKRKRNRRNCWALSQR